MNKELKQLMKSVVVVKTSKGGSRPRGITLFGAWSAINGTICAFQTGDFNTCYAEALPHLMSTLF